MIIEYNCRMGDPETEVVLPKLKNDLVDLFLAVEQGSLKECVIEMDASAFCTVVAVSGGYPGSYEKNLPIAGLEASTLDRDVFIFHAGTKRAGNEVVTNGGRVLTVTSKGDNLKDAVAKSIDALERISFKGMYFRKDIGYEFE